MWRFKRILEEPFQKVAHIQNLEVISVGIDWRTPFWNDIDAGIKVSHIVYTNIISSRNLNFNQSISSHMLSHRPSYRFALNYMAGGPKLNSSDTKLIGTKTRPQEITRQTK